MSPTASPHFDYSNINRAAINRANSEHSTGPRTEAGKERSSRNSLRHGLTARSAVLPSEDGAAFEQHCRQFIEEYQPATATETHLVQELADTSWRLRRVPLLEATLLAEATRPEQHANPQPTIQTLANLGLHGARLSRQFHKTLEQLLKIQSARRERECRDLKGSTAATLEQTKNKRVPSEPVDNGFVFSKGQLNHSAQRATPQEEPGFDSAQPANAH